MIHHLLQKKFWYQAINKSFPMQPLRKNFKENHTFLDQLLATDYQVIPVSGINKPSIYHGTITESNFRTYPQ